MKLFGTDGIRGRAGNAPLIPETVARVGAALVKTMIASDPSHAQPTTRSHRGGPGCRYVIGRDTRESGSWIEDELTRGLTAEGATVVSAGVVPTPAIAYLARTEGFDAGIVISASHNPYEDNGIKVFGGSGTKLSERLESSVEAMVADTSWTVPAASGALDPPRSVGALRRPSAGNPEARRRAGRVEDRHRLREWRDHAARSGLFRDLGFDVDAIGIAPDGRNINLDCGSTHLERAGQGGGCVEGAHRASHSTVTATARFSSITPAGLSTVTPFC